MNFKQLVFLVPFWLFLNTACVSVNLAKNDVQRAKNLNFKAPKGGFSEFESDLVDKGWRNSSNGNAISFISDCQNPYDPTLSNIESGVLGSIQKRETLFSKQEIFNDRASLHSLYKGFVDGIPTHVELMTFKKNGCIYVISYVAVEEHYSNNSEHFAEFLRKFRAP